MDSTEILHVIPDNKLTQLKHILKQDYPENIHVFNFIDTTIQLKKARPNENYVTILCPDGDISDGTFVAIIDMFCYDVLIYTMDKSLKRLEKSLRETKRIDYDRKPLFCAMFQSYFDMVFKVRNEIGKPFPSYVPCYVWWLPKEKALEYEYSIPDDVFVAPLNESHSITINEVWPHKYSGSEKYLAKLIELNGAIGIFAKEDNELCAWVLKNYFGGLGMLQVAEKHKRKGYGTLVTKIFSKIIAQEDGYDLSGFIVIKNVASQEMFSRLGFKKISPVTWLEN